MANNNVQSEKQPTSLADQLNARNKQLKDSAIVNQKGISKDVVINEGTKYEYTLTMQFPGVAIASSIEDDATRADGSIRFTDLMQGAVDNNIFVQPHIKSLDFWDTHKGYGDVAGELLNFLNDGIAGNLE